MSEELNLIIQLALLLIAAGTFTILSKVLHQPLILGYIVAGFIIGPHLGLIPQFSPESVKAWSEIGIIFLLFGLGLEFNFKKLLNVGSAGMIGALTICLGMFMVGFLVGETFGWRMIESIFLGGMLSMSSTTIIIKAYDDLEMKHASFAPLVFGILVVEDLLAVLIMVLFSTIAVSNQFSGTELILSIAKLTVFLVLCFVVGIYVFPSILKKYKNYLSDEILLLISVGSCLLMVICANMSGFSSALGAFLMGSILSSTIVGERIEKITTNIKNLFGAIFFVSVGMMVQPNVIVEYWPIILVLTLVVIIGIMLFSVMGVLFAGKNLDTAIHVGFSLPQLGEFSFIIAGLGCSLGVLDDFIYPVIISVSVITTFTTPYMIKSANPVSAWLHGKLPQKTVIHINRRALPDDFSNKAENNMWKQFFKFYFIRVSIYGLILVVILLGTKEYIPRLFSYISLNRFLSPFFITLLEVIVVILIMYPFLYGLVVNGEKIKSIAEVICKKDPKAKIPIMAANIFRALVAVYIIILTIFSFMDISAWAMIFLVICIGLVFFISRNTAYKFARIEDRFITNLNEKETYERMISPVATTLKQKLSSYNVVTEQFTISSDFKYIGKELREIPLRELTGVNIVKIVRGQQSILIPDAKERIYPSDRIVAVGTSEQMSKFRQELHDFSLRSTTALQPFAKSSTEFNVESITITDQSVLTGKYLKDSDIKSSGCMVVSVVRNGAYYTNPHKDFKFAVGDEVWLAGLQTSIDWFK